MLPAPNCTRSVFPPSILLGLSFFFAWFVTSTSVHAENWPMWRGPTYNGVTSEKAAPIEWSETKNIVWRCDLPEFGRSAPIVWDDAIFLTSQKDNRLLLLKINKQDGQIEWTREVGRGKPQQSPARGKKGETRRSQLFHNEQNMASPSCATDGDLVAVHFGNGDLAVYDFSGRQLWKLNLQEEYGPFTVWWGHANSPVLCGEYVVVMAIQDSCDDLPGKPSESYLVALDRRTGKEVWRTLRMTGAKQEDGDSYTTPIVRKLKSRPENPTFVQNGAGRRTISGSFQIDSKSRTELVVLGGECLDAYDLATGRRTWFLPRFSGSRTVTGPVVVGNTVVATHGKRGPMIAIKLEGSGKQSEEQILWTHQQGTPDSSWPVVVKGLLFYVSDNGIAHCLDMTDGKVLWKKRLPGSPYRASLMTDGKNVYFTGTRGVTTVVRASDQFEKIAENHLDDKLYSSPVVSGGQILLRGQKRLYCIGK